MLMRVACLLLILLGAPAASWAASLCCEPAGCCEEDAACPVLPNGACALESAARAPALATTEDTDAPGPDLPVLAAQPSLAHHDARAVAAPSAVPRFLLLRSLKN